MKNLNKNFEFKGILKGIAFLMLVCLATMGVAYSIASVSVPKEIGGGGGRIPGPPEVTLIAELPTSTCCEIGGNRPQETVPICVSPNYEIGGGRCPSGGLIVDVSSSCNIGGNTDVKRPYSICDENAIGGKSTPDVLKIVASTPTDIGGTQGLPRGVSLTEDQYCPDMHQKLARCMLRDFD